MAKLCASVDKITNRPISLSYSTFSYFKKTWGVLKKDFCQYFFSCKINHNFLMFC